MSAFSAFSLKACLVVKRNSMERAPSKRRDTNNGITSIVYEPRFCGLHNFFVFSVYDPKHSLQQQHSPRIVGRDKSHRFLLQLPGSWAKLSLLKVVIKGFATNSPTAPSSPPSHGSQPSQRYELRFGEDYEVIPYDLFSNQLCVKIRLPSYLIKDSGERDDLILCFELEGSGSKVGNEERSVYAGRIATVSPANRRADLIHALTSYFYPHGQVWYSNTILLVATTRI